MRITLNEFNLRFLAELNRYNRELKHLASGSNGKHPLLRKALLADVKSDLAVFGLAYTLNKWGPFIGLPKVPGIKPLPGPEKPSDFDSSVPLALKGGKDG